MILLSIVLGAVEVALVGVFLLTAAEAAILRGLGMRDQMFRLGEFHHGYAGLLLVLAGWWISPWLMLAGVLISADDAYQHFRQTWYSEPEYRSPLHLLFRWTLWKLAAIRNLTRWLDRRL